MKKEFREKSSKEKEVKPSSYDFGRASKKGDSSESSEQKRQEMEAKIRDLERQKVAAEHNIRTMDTLIADYQRTANELDTAFLAMTRDMEITLTQHQKAKDVLERTSKQENKLSETTDMTAALSTQMEELHLEVKRQHFGLKQLAKEWQYKQDQRFELDQTRTANKEWLKKYKKQKWDYVSQRLDLDLKINRLKAELKGLP